MTVRESVIVDAIVKAAERCGCFVFKIHGHPMQQAGMPDLLLARFARVVFIEVMKPGENAEPLQRFMMKKIERVGVKCGVAHSAAEAGDLLHDWGLLARHELFGKWEVE